MPTMIASDLEFVDTTAGALQYLAGGTEVSLDGWRRDGNSAGNQRRRSRIW